MLAAAVVNSQVALRIDILVVFEQRIGLSHQTGACRMIGSMNLAMTIAATPGEQVVVAAVEGGAIGKSAGMTAAHMTLLAEERGARHKHRFDGGAVRLMTQTTVLCDRVVFKQKGSSSLWMALSTGVSRIGSFQGVITHIAMGVVAVTTNDLALGDRMAGWIVQ